MWLLIDDVRDLNVDVIARTDRAAIKCLAVGGWEVILFDHDLGENCASGYEVLQHALLHDWLGDAKIRFVTSNPVGRQNMERALEAAGYTKNYEKQEWSK